MTEEKQDRNRKYLKFFKININNASHLPPGLASVSLRTSTLYTFPNSTFHATCLSHRDFVTPVSFVQKYKS
jgi:hypothetical protein